MTDVARKIKIYGKVQKVGFRKFIQTQAKRLNITGYVKNENEGYVFAYIVGSENQVKELIELCRKGPKRANVDLIEIYDADIIKFPDFEIHYE